jgi:predicted component of type VI protein secretion system
VPRLIVIRGVDEGKQFELTGGTVTVGRHSSNAIPLHDTQVSRRHLEVRAAPAGYELHDLGSGNGTLLNGRPVQQAPLRSGDTVTVGQSVLMFTVGHNELPAAGNELTERVRLQAAARAGPRVGHPAHRRRPTPAARSSAARRVPPTGSRHGSPASPRCTKPPRSSATSSTSISCSTP